MAWNFGDWGSWGIGDMRNGENELREAIASGKPFDTGWHGWKKELQSMRICRTDETITVEVNEYMDDLEDYAIICDCLTDEEIDAITDDQLEEISNELSEIYMDFYTEFEMSASLPLTATYDEVMAKASELMQECDNALTESFHLCIEVTLSVLYPDAENLNEMIMDRIEEMDK